MWPCKSFTSSKYTKLFQHDVWNIGIITQPIHQVVKHGMGKKINWLPPPTKGTFIADPFGLYHKGALTILCEHFDYRTGKGTLQAIEIAKGWTPRQAIGILHSKFHQSYPYLIKHKEEIFCIPERSAAGEINLYKAVTFPGKWMKVKTIVRGTGGVDPTISNFEGRWWLWCTDPKRGSDSTLLLWFADDLIGPWYPHPANPIKVDSRSSRSAGTPYIYEGVLYRPAQDCSKKYGAKIVINRILCMTTDNYLEEETTIIQPDQTGFFRDGIHTISAVGDLTLVDGRRTNFLWDGFKLSITRGLHRIKW